jgi:DNA-binding NtrC family response regulator
MAVSKRTVLVVDDDREMTAIIRKILVRENYEVMTAENGKEALVLMHHKPVHVVIADLKMPECDGMRLIEVMRQEFPRTKVIMITAFGEMDDYLGAMNRGAFEFLSKPLNIDELKMLVTRAMETTQQRAVSP